MKSMLIKPALLATLIAGSGVLAASAYATNGGNTDNKAGCETRHGQMMKAKWEARHEARMSGLKEKLKLAPAQEAAWQAFAGSATPGPQAAGIDRQAMRESFAKMTAPQRMDALLEKADLRRAHLAARAAAVKRFYAELTPEQQAVFDAEAMPLSGRGHGDGHHATKRRQS